ncbi:Xaa-Pro dipeptidyl-peptidase [Streptococcus dentiloxodontae]
MRFNQFSYIPVSAKSAEQELQRLGFDVHADLPSKTNFEIFIRKALFLHGNTDLALKNWIADWKTDLLTFFHSQAELTKDIFNLAALQLLGFVPFVDFTDTAEFVKQTAFPIVFDGSIANLHQLLATRCKSGNTLIDQLVSEGLIPISNHYIYFNGKSLATFDTAALIRETVYVETPLDTDKDGKTDLIKVSILRPRVAFKVPVMMTASPYHQGVNVPASDKKTHKMEGELTVKKAGAITLEEPIITTLQTKNPITEEAENAEEHFSHTDTYSLNDYMLARGIASVYVAGIGTLNSDGFMTSGDYHQVLAYQAVIDWLNDRATAFTSPNRSHHIKAHWASGKVATTGLSYLGTMSNALATTGVEGLEVVIAEAGISSWYDYYRENGLVTSPGDYPGEDSDSLTEFTYSRNLLAGEYLRSNANYQEFLNDLSSAIDRNSGDYNQFWHERNYRLHADKVKATLVFTHGSQDWNVKPINVYKMFHALPESVDKHLFFHHGAHVYMNAWQSIDFRESINALLSQKLLGYANGFGLPKVIWQDNQAEQTWQILEDFDSQTYQKFELGDKLATIANHYNKASFDRYCKNYQEFKSDLFDQKAQAISIDFTLGRDLHLNGRSRLKLTLKSTVNRGLLSVQLLEIGDKKYLTPLPAVKTSDSVDNGRLFKQEALRELPLVTGKNRVITKSHLNLQNRDGLLTIKEVVADQWMTLSLDLQPSIYKLTKGDKLRLLLYTTDFEHTIRDNSDYQLIVDLGHSSLELPIEK